MISAHINVTTIYMLDHTPPVSIVSYLLVFDPQFDSISHPQASSDHAVIVSTKPKVH